MQLVDWQIRKYVESGKLGITPFNIEQINPNSYDLRLADEFVRYRDFIEIDEDYNTTIIDPYNPDTINYELETVESETYIIKPYEFILARTVETVSLPDDICAQVGGKSSLARIGLSVHQTAGFGDAGFSGTYTLELFNANRRPIKLYAGMKIAQIMFNETEKACRPYNVRKSSKYQDQVNTTISKYDLNTKPQLEIRNV